MPALLPLAAAGGAVAVGAKRIRKYLADSSTGRDKSDSSESRSRWKRRLDEALDQLDAAGAEIAARSAELYSHGQIPMPG